MDISKIQILIVDDRELNREMYEEALKPYGFEIFCANGGNVAWELLKNKPIDLLITDLRMADGTGIELLRHLKKRSEQAKKIPRIIVATGVLDGGESYLKALGANEIYLKPVDPEVLVKKTFELLDLEFPG